MKKLKIGMTVGIFFFLSGFAQARPLLLEEVPTIGHHHFETGFSFSDRRDKFSSQGTSLETEVFPIFFRFGLSEFLDISAEFQHVSQSLETEGAKLTGSSNAQLSPAIKYSPTAWYGFQGIWHVKKSEQASDDIPIGHGNDVELKALLKPLTYWPINFNVGYDIRGNYYTQMGDANGPAHRMAPGNIFELGGSLEIPLQYHFSLLSESVYSYVQKTKFDGESVAGTAGEALDLLGGLCWATGGWTLQGGVAFGLLGENHSSFDVNHGAGDVMYKFAVAYNLMPTKPSQ